MEKQKTKTLCKKSISLLLALLLVLSAIPLGGLTAFAATSGDFEYNVLSEEDKTCEITKYTGSASELNIPSVLSGYQVKEIGRAAFENCASLISVNISHGVTNIKPDAFQGCTALENINIPNSVTTIDDNAFEECTSLTSVTIPDSVTIIGYDAFRNCISLTSITIPNSVTETGTSVFEGCTSLTSATISGNITYMGWGMFSGCTSLTNVTISDGVTEISDGTFQNCTALTSIIIPDSVSIIGAYAFSGCTSLTDVMIPDSVRILDSYAFEGCSSLINITIPNSVTNIKNNAFENCTSLENINISNNLTEIGFDAFYGTKFYNDDQNWENYFLYFDNYLIDSSLFIPENCTIKEGTKLIAGGALAHTGLKSISIPNTVKYINERAFWGSGLINISIPDSVTSIGDQAFWGCNSLTSITIPDSITSIDTYMFYKCENLEEITLPDSITEIGYAAFLDTAYYNNTNNWDNGLLYIGNHLIKAQEDVAGEYNIRANIKTIADYAFAECPMLLGVTIPASVKTIGTWAFGECEKLEYVNILNIEDSVLTLIGNQAFNGCLKLSSFTLPDSVKIIQDFAFSRTALSNIEMNNVTELGACVFQNCSQLTSIIIPDGITQIGWNTFLGCSSLIHIAIPSSVNKIVWGAFRDCYSLNHIFYSGTQEQWNNINIEEDGNTRLFNTPKHFNVPIGENKIEIYETEATCTEASYLQTKCLICDEIIHSRFLAFALGHTKGEIVEVVPPTCTSEGYTKYSCSVCGEEFCTDWTYEEHNYSVLLESHEPTCTEQGYAVYRCETCEDTIFTYTAFALGHEFNNDICTRCGMHKTDCLESSHPYANNTDETWVLNKPGAQSVAVTFSSDTSVESGWDYIYIYDANDVLIGKYTGNELASKQIVVLGDTVKIRLTSDSSGTGFGFALSNVEINKTQSVESDEITVTEGKIGDFSADTKLKVENLEAEDGQIKYDITLMQGEIPVQPTAPVTVKIPVPATMDGSKCKVYRQEADGTYTDMQAIYQDGYMVFTTDHFSIYVLTVKDPNAPAIAAGDVNGDGVINAVDARWALQSASGVRTLSDEQLAAADVNGDGVINAVDARWILQAASGVRVL